MKRALFVDDEPMVLRSLQALLRPLRHEWEMVFAVGADAALVELQKGSFDVVCSDMRMPRIDGAELLRRVHQLSPDTGRLILTGYADEEARSRAALVANLCLEKPCDFEDLKHALEDVAR